MAKPRLDFIVAGVQKGGTSALDYYLRQHGEINMGKKKELHFFDTEKFFSGPEVNYELLHKKLQRRPNTKITGESTPSYIYWNNAIERIKSYNPEIKLIVILRNPIDRAFSHWNMEISRERETKDFLKCLELEKKRLVRALPNQTKIFSYFDRGFYSWQILRLKRFFSDENLHFIKYDDFKVNQEEQVKSVFEFLGLNLPENFKLIEKQVHAISHRRKITEDERKTLIEYYRNDIEYTAKLLNWDCTNWLQ